MKHPHELPAPAQHPSGSIAWDGAPDAVIPGRLERISEESRQILLAACRACTIDGFLLAAAVIPAKTDKDGNAYIDESRRGSTFTNLEHGSDLTSLLLYAAERSKRRQ
jgi:hypothetical protein